jgi:hypothetical protein
MGSPLCQHLARVSIDAEARYLTVLNSPPSRVWPRLRMLLGTRNFLDAL